MAMIWATVLMVGRTNNSLFVISAHQSSHCRPGWMSLFDESVLSPHDPNSAPKSVSADACGRSAERELKQSSKYILVVGGMQNLEDYQGSEPLPVHFWTRITSNL